MHPLRPGDPDRLGAYALFGRLTDGPRGDAYLGKESDDSPTRVIKLLPAPSEGAEPQSAERFAAVQRISSAYVARTVDAGVHEGRLYVVREHIEGRNLAETVAADGPLDGDALERVAVGVLTALTAVHLAGVTHRGITPQNVIIGADGPRVTDVDLGDAAGEPGYRSPEQLSGLAYGPYADVFSWAATIVFAATGKAPFGPDPDGVLNGEPELGGLGEPLRRVALSALSKDVAQRPTTYTALLQLLGDKNAQNVQAAPPVVVPPLDAPVGGPPNLQQQPTEYLPPIEGVPVPQQQNRAVAQVPQQSWGPPAEQSWGPQPEQSWGPEQSYGPAQGQQGPSWGPPPVPQDAPAAGPPGSPPHQVWQAPGQKSPRRSFPVGLVAAITAAVVLSGVGLWGAGHYAKIQAVPAAASGAEAAKNNALALGGSGDNTTTGQVGPVGQPSDQPAQPDITVPWAATPDPTDVAPLVLPTDYPTDLATPPEFTSIPTPQPLGTQPITVPSGQPTAGQPTVQQTGPPTGRPTGAQPTATVTRSVQPSGTPAPTQSPTQATSPAQSPAQSPTQEQQPDPAPSKTKEPDPAPSQSAPPKTTAAPTPSKTTAAPKPTPSKTTTAPKPTPAKTTAAPPAPKKNPYTAAQVCGSGYGQQRSSSFNGGVTYQMYNNSTGQNCVVTMKTTDVGVKTQVSATLEVQGGSTKSDSGSYDYYAGPVYLPAKGKCVKYSGSTSSGSTGSVNWGNCG